MKYYLDTNIIIYALKGSFPSIADHFRNTPAQSIVIPSVVMAEIEYGAQKSVNYDITIQKYRRFTDVFEKVPFSGHAVSAYGEIRSFLERSGTPIGPNNLMIAATVYSENGILVTHNTREFSRVPGLHIVDWTL